MIFVKGSSGLGLLVPATLLLHFHTRIPPIYSPSNRDFLVVRCFAIHCEALGLAITQESESWSSTGLKFQDSDNDTKGQSRRIDKSDRNLGNLLQELLTCHRPLLARLYRFLHKFQLNVPNRSHESRSRVTENSLPQSHSQWTGIVVQLAEHGFPGVPLSFQPLLFMS